MNENNLNNNLDIKPQNFNNIQSNINPNETTQKLEIVNPLNPEEIIKTETLVKKQIIQEDDEEVQNNEPKKSKKNILILIILIIVIAIGITTYFIISNKTNTPPDIEQPIVKTINLNDIANYFNNNNIINELKKTNEISTNIENNNLIINITTNEQVNNYTFTLENRELIYELDTTDSNNNLLFLVICDNIGQFHGLQEGETYNFLSSIDLLSTTIDGIIINKIENNYQARINIDTKFNTSSLKTMYYGIEDLEEYKDFIKNDGIVTLPRKGNLMFYKENDKKTITILIGENDNLTDLTYKSILSVIEFLYPEELENFQKSYPKLDNVSFDRYTFTINPDFTGSIKTLFEQYKNEYEFILITINKSS